MSAIWILLSLFDLYLVYTTVNPNWNLLKQRVKDVVHAVQIWRKIKISKILYQLHNRKKNVLHNLDKLVDHLEYFSMEMLK